MAVEVRRRVNILDNLTTTKAVDALLNAETVALFNNRGEGRAAPGNPNAICMCCTDALLCWASLNVFSGGCRFEHVQHLPPHCHPSDLEVLQYDHYLRGYQAAAIQTERLAATLNAGQAVVLTVGLTLVLISAVVGVPAAGGAAVARTFSPGDLVLLQGLLLQLWSPLAFLGWFYR